MKYCRICKFWNFPQSIQINQFLQYDRERNIGNFIFPSERCDYSCGRICCKPENRELIQSTDHPNSYYQDLVDKATNLQYFDNTIYEKAIIAESKLTSRHLVKSYFHDPVFHMVLTRQKYRYYLNRKETLNSSEQEIFDQLEFQVGADEFNRKYYYIFGNALQKLALGLADQQLLVQLLKETRGLKQSNLILPFLDIKYLEEIKSPFFPNINLIKLSKFTFQEKFELFGTIHSTAEKLALLHYMKEEELITTYQSYQSELQDIPILLKLLSMIENRKILEKFKDHPSPHIRGIILHKITRNTLSSNYQAQLQELFINHQIFVPVPDNEQLYYDCLLTAPDHEMADYLIQSLFDIQLLKKLMFLPHIRKRIRQRITYLQQK